MGAALVTAGGAELAVAPDRVDLNPPLSFLLDTSNRWTIRTTEYDYLVSGFGDYTPAALETLQTLIPIGYPLYVPPVDPLPVGYPGGAPLNGGFGIVSSIEFDDRFGNYLNIGMRTLTDDTQVSTSDPPILIGDGIERHGIDTRDPSQDGVLYDLGSPYVVTAPGSVDTDGFTQITLPNDLILPTNLQGYPPLPNVAAGTPPMPGTLANGSLRIQKYTGIAESSSGEQSYTLESELSGIPDTAKVRITGPSAVELLAGDLSGFVLTVEHMGTARILINDCPSQWNINQFTRTGEKNYSVILTRDVADG